MEIIIKGTSTEPFTGEIVDATHLRQVSETGIPNNKKTCYALRVGHDTSQCHSYKLHFQAGNPVQFGKNGFTNEEVIQVLIDRITFHNGIVYNLLNDEALHHLKLAHKALEARIAYIIKQKSDNVQLTESNSEK